MAFFGGNRTVPGRACRVQGDGVAHHPLDAADRPPRARAARHRSHFRYPSWRSAPPPLPLSSSSQPPTACRFWAKVARTPGCWWRGGVAPRRVRPHQLDPRRAAPHPLRPPVRAAPGHRPLEHHTVAEHHCNETLCVRVHPAHPHPGTQSANLRYAVALGRHRGPRPGDIDPRGCYAPALDIRAALTTGYDPIRLAYARNPDPPPPCLTSPTPTPPAPAEVGVVTTRPPVTGSHDPTRTQRVIALTVATAVPRTADSVA